MRVERRMDEVDGDVVWNLLTATRKWPSWGPTVAEVDGPEIISEGSAVRIRPALLPRRLGVWIPFEIDSFTSSGERRTWGWSVGGVRATDHSVVSDGSDGCVVSMSAPWWAWPYLPVLWLGLRNLERMAETDLS